MTSQNAIAALLVVAAVALVIYRLRQIVRGKGGCGCCDMKDACDNDNGGNQEQGAGNPSSETAEPGTRNK